MSIVHFPLSPTESFLCECIRHIDSIDCEKIASQYSELGDDKAWESAKTNGVTTNVAHALDKVLGNRLPKRWKLAYQEMERKISMYMAELDKAAALLAADGIELVTLKNSGITRGIYQHPGASPMGDIDVIVRKSRFREAHAILSRAGYKLKFRCPFEEDSLEAAEEGGGAEYSVIMKNGEQLWFELQWRPVAGRWIQADQEPKADDFIDRSSEMEGTKARLLAAQDNLLQVALHTAKHTFVRAPGFRLHTDVDRIVRSEKIDWIAFVREVKRLRISTSVFFSLSMAKTLLSTPIPNEALREIAPASWKVSLMNAWLRKVGIFHPNEPKWSKIGYICFVSLLYDSLSDFWNGLFPTIPAEERLKHSSAFAFHRQRIQNLIFRRTNT